MVYVVRKGVLTTRIRDDIIQEYRTSLSGQLILPGHPIYNEVRKVWNAMIDKRPALIVRCMGAADVVKSINFARANNLLVSVRGGGHNVGGKAVCDDDGIMIDLSLMKGIWVDPSHKVAQAQPGLRLGEFDRETQAFGLATTLGVISNTGIAGLTLGGGVGWLTRKYGLACDNLLSVDIVTADGQFLKASDAVNKDLFWGIRGGGGNFGIVTSFEYQLHPVGPQVLAGMVLHPFEKAREALKFYRDYSASIPEDMNTICALLTSPEGHPMVAIVVCYHGDIMDKGQQILEPLREFGPPLEDLIRPMSYIEAQSMFDLAIPPSGLRSYWKSHFLKDISDQAIDTLIAHFAKVPSPRTAILFQQFGGKASQVREDATAFGHRKDGEYDFIIFSLWQNSSDDDANIRWTRRLWDKMKPFSPGGVYVNNLGDDEPEGRVRAAYGPNYDRLVELKNKYDPANLFRLNQNIKPVILT
jgi:FAD/FMN-containing dehydrogenase